MSLQFHETVRGRNFFEVQLPKLIKAIDKMAAAIEERNELLKEQILLNDTKGCDKND